MPAVTGKELLLKAVDPETGRAGQPRVKAPSTQYSDATYTAKHAKTGQPVFFGTEELRTSSQRDHAMFGAWIKNQVQFERNRNGNDAPTLNEHERELLREMFATKGFYHADLQGASSYDEAPFRYVKGDRVKAVINDGTSGGQELVPEFFDQAVIQFPLLHSEILPFVDLKRINRGSSVETASVGNPTVTWNQAEASAISLFDTTGLISEITASIFNVMVAIEIGLDLMGDSVADIGATIEQNIGQRMLAEFDQVITSGDGSTQPQGIDNASGTTDVTAGNPTTGDVLVSDLMNLAFAVAKQYRQNAAWNPRFIMTDTTYKRFRSVATGVTGDTRFHLGNDVASYDLLEWPVSIDNTGLANSQAIFGALKKYRLWMRQGVNVRTSDTGDTNLRRNTMTMVVRSRVGGKVVDGNAFAVMDSLQA